MLDRLSTRTTDRTDTTWCNMMQQCPHRLFTDLNRFRRITVFSASWALRMSLCGFGMRRRHWQRMCLHVFTVAYYMCSLWLTSCHVLACLRTSWDIFTASVLLTFDFGVSFLSSCRRRCSTRTSAMCQLCTKYLTKSLWTRLTTYREIPKWRC